MSGGGRDTGTKLAPGSPAQLGSNFLQNTRLAGPDHLLSLPSSTRAGQTEEIGTIISQPVTVEL